MDSWGAKHRTIGQKERLQMCYCNQDRHFFRSFQDLSKQGTIFIRLQKESNLSNKGLFVHSAPEKSRRIVAHSNLLGASFHSAPEKSRRIVAHSNLLGASFRMPMHSASSQRWGTYTFPSGSRPRWCLAMVKAQSMSSSIFRRCPSTLMVIVTTSGSFGKRTERGLLSRPQVRG